MNFATIDIEWDIGPKTWDIQMPWPVADLVLLKDKAVSKPKVHNVSGVEADDWIDYSYTLKASFAFSLLQGAGKIPPDAELQTFGEDVPYDADGEQEEGELRGEDEG